MNNKYFFVSSNILKYFYNIVQGLGQLTIVLVTSCNPRAGHSVQ